MNGSRSFESIRFPFERYLKAGKLLAEVGGADGHAGIPGGVDLPRRFGNLKHVFAGCFQAFGKSL